MRCELHSILTEDGTLIEGWGWMDQSDHVNVVVRLVDSNGNEKFPVFKQKKYGLYRRSFAPVGGGMEPGETAEETARRELLEEMRLECSNWHSFQVEGFRVDANRGAGFVHIFLAQECTNATIAASKDTKDLEAQELVYLSREELQRHILNGDFSEVKWNASFLLALLITGPANDRMLPTS